MLDRQGPGHPPGARPAARARLASWRAPAGEQLRVRRPLDRRPRRPARRDEARAQHGHVVRHVATSSARSRSASSRARCSSAPRSRSSGQIGPDTLEADRPRGRAARRRSRSRTRGSVLEANWGAVDETGERAARARDALRRRARRRALDRPADADRGRLGRAADDDARPRHAMSPPPTVNSRGRVLRRALAARRGAAALVAPCARAPRRDPTWRLEQPPPPAGAPFKVRARRTRRPAVLGAQSRPARRRGQRRDPRAACSSTTGALAPAVDGLRRLDGHHAHRLGRADASGGRSARRAGRGSATASRSATSGRRGRRVLRQAPESADPYLPMNAATCARPDDCWFGGVGATRPDGRARRRLPAPLGRRVADDRLRAAGPRHHAISRRTTARSTRASSSAHGRATARRRAPRGRDRPACCCIAAPARAFVNDPFVPAALARRPDDGIGAARAGQRRRAALGRRRRRRVRAERAQRRHRRAAAARRRAARA